MSKWIAVCMLCLSLANGAVAQEVSMVKLPPPDMHGGKPLMQALKERHSTREFSAEPLPHSSCLTCCGRRWA
jgi:hypothetical protein